MSVILKGWLKQKVGKEYRWQMREPDFSSRLAKTIYLELFWLSTPPDFKVLEFRFSSPVRRRVAQAGQGVSARTV